MAACSQADTPYHAALTSANRSGAAAASNTPTVAEAAHPAAGHSGNVLALLSVLP